MITSLTWVPKGVARARPVRFELSPEEYQRIKLMANAEQAKEREGEEDHEALGLTFKGSASVVAMDEEEAVDVSDLPAELRMDAYDDDDDDDNDNEGERIELADVEEELEDDDEDIDKFAVLEQGDVALAMLADDDDEDAEDDEIRPTDSLLVVAVTEDEYSHLEVQLLSEDGSMFVHHDITLPEFPLCLAWMDCPPFQADGGQLAMGNYVAVGSFDPAIEIWNLDVLDPLEPTAVLGGVIAEQKTLPGKKSSKKKKGGQSRGLPELNVGSHEEAVMTLSWNRKYRQALASGSADNTVKIWDVTTQACQHTFTHHTDKVQSVVWHYEEAWLLASGAFDKTVALLDCRTGTRASSYNLTADVESMVWDPFCAFHLYCAMEDGHVACFDLRLPKVPFSLFQAHDKTTSSISFSSGVRGMFATASVDKTVKVWDANNIHEAAATSAAAAARAGTGSGMTPGLVGLEPRNVMYKTMNVGKLFTMQFYEDDPFVLACAGDKALVAVWESDEAEVVRNHFQDKLVSRTAAAIDTTTSGAPADLSGAMSLSGHKDSLTHPVETDDSWMDEEITTSTSSLPKAKSQKNKSKDKKKDKKPK